ncbi:MAG: Gfo/Idh/MocA family protein [Opitutales bacterium]
MKVLFLGLGSIGQRHLRNWITARGHTDEIWALRTSRHQQVIEKGAAQAVTNLSTALGIHETRDEEAAWAINPDLVFITNPTSKHTEAILNALSCGSAVFVEKPIGCSSEDFEKLSEVPKRAPVFVGYQNRFHPFFLKIKELINSGHLGDIIEAKIWWHTWLPGHHPYEDFRTSYAARGDLGGGACLGLSHDIDWLLGIWGAPNRITHSSTSSPILKMQVDERCEAKLEYLRPSAPKSLKLSLSYSHREESHAVHIVGTQASVIADWESNSLKVVRSDGEAEHLDFKVTHPRDRLFELQTQSLISALEDPSKWIGASIEDGIKTLELCIQIMATSGKSV